MRTDEEASSRFAASRKTAMLRFIGRFCLSRGLEKVCSFGISFRSTTSAKELLLTDAVKVSWQFDCAALGG